MDKSKQDTILLKRGGNKKLIDTQIVQTTQRQSSPIVFVLKMEEHSWRKKIVEKKELIS